MNARELHERASELFLELRALPAERRADALAAAAAGDERLAAEVAALLEHDVDAPPAARGAVRAGADATLPARIGPYRVLSRVGRGGSGQVFLAEQDVPIRRRVAIKVVPQAALSPEIAARFEIERRVLETTDHPNITRVLDAGTTSDGLPYLVMNFVEGESITAHCVRRGLALTERIRLMLDVAGAVQHAHQRGVIHRDLKPANVLVTEQDGRAVPQVLDFGIAKPVAGILASESPPTLGLPLGTPAYMAPEQTGAGSVDTRADVYALGAMLYELVAGKPPIRLTSAGERGLDGADPLETLRRIREEVAPPASRARAERAALGDPGVSPDEPGGRTRHGKRTFLADLDVVLGKALEKDPERRYGSVGALIDDLRRLLACEPIAARAPTLRYRASRFALRNRALVAAAAVVVVALVVGIVGLLAGLFEARRQRIVAQNQTDAQREINRFLTEDLLGAAGPDREGADVTVRELLDRASKRIKDRFPNRPLTAAAVDHALGEAYAELGAFDEAERHLERAVAMRRTFAGPDAPDTLRSQIAAASLLGRRERIDEAEAALRPLIPRARAILGEDDPVLYAALNDLGVVLLYQEQVDEAKALLEEALAGRRRVLGPDAPLVAITLSNLAQVPDQTGDSEATLELLREALRVAESASDPPRRVVLGLHNNIGATLQDLERDREAEPHLRRSAELAAELLGPDHPDTLLIQSNLAGLESDLGEPERALELYERVIAGQTRSLGPSAPDTLIARYGYWNAAWKAGDFDGAAAGFEELVADVVAALGANDRLAAQSESALARALADGGRKDEALPHAERAAARLAQIYGSDHPRTRSAQQLAEELLAAGEGE